MKIQGRFVFLLISTMAVSFTAFSQTGSILREYWTGISGSTVSALTGNANYPDNPNGSNYLTSYLEDPVNWNDNYGTRIRGYVHPPATGNYIFWIASDDNSELWLSSDDKQAHKTLIASVTGYTSSQEWTKYSTQQSAAINLVAGRRYYIEVLHKDGDQGDNCAVGWQLPNSTYERPIPANRLSPVTDNDDYSLWTNAAFIFMNTTAAGANIMQNVVNIPVLVRLNESNFDFSSALPNGADLRFAKSDGTHLKYQIEQWDTLTKNAAIWVRIDTVYGNDSTHSITMLWGKTNAISRSNGNAVFDTANGFRGVWHMNQVPPGTVSDATINGNNGVVQGGMNASSSVAGVVGKGLKFIDSDSDYCDMGNSTTLQITTGEVTVSAWVKSNAINTAMGIGGKMTYSSYRGYSINKYNTNYFQFQTGNGSTDEKLPSNVTYTDTNWHYVVGMRRESVNYLYIDGVQQTATGTLSFVDNGSYASTGKHYANYNGRYWNGRIDEMRIDSKGRSTAWVKLCYENQRAGSVFLIIQKADVKPVVNLVSHIATVAETSITVIPFSVTATIGAPADSPLTIIIPLIYSGSASSGSDYVPLVTNVELTIQDDSTVATVPVSFTPLEDTLNEGNESLYVALGTDTSYNRGETDAVSIIITDNDQKYPPQITVNPVNVSVLEGDPATFSVTVTGTPPFTYQWRKNGIPTGSGSGSYSIPFVTRADSGAHFDCIVINSVGRDTSGSASLSVSLRPEVPVIIRHPQAQLLAEGDSVELNIAVTGTAPFTFQWFCNGIAISGATDSIYRTGPVGIEDNGKHFYCMVNNSIAGIQSKNALLTVRRPSSQTVIITGDLLTSRNIRVGIQDETRMNFIVRLYASVTSDSAIYTETFLDTNNQAIAVKDGKFAIHLGTGKTTGNLTEVVRTYPNIFVSFSIASIGGNFETLDKKVPFTASPYALSGLPQILKGIVNPDSAMIEAPIGTHYVRTSTNDTYIRTFRGWARMGD
ncbi:MAG TPA: DUF2341 domain-containing protein [Chitinispirillaceae bacterium]|nr:DUF2341 domain-containing protein [Chitinispirillaceae bacterium]